MKIKKIMWIKHEKSHWTYDKKNYTLRNIDK